MQLRLESVRSVEVNFLFLLCMAWTCTAIVNDACHVCNCDRLRKRVNCTRRNLTSVPPGIPLDTAYLDLRDNNITTLKKDDVRHCSWLHNLHLDRNNISVIEPGAFTGLDKLFSLALSLNPLRELDANIVGELHVSWLGFEVEDCHITTLKPLTFGGISNVYRVRFRGNKLTEIPSKLFYTEGREHDMYGIDFTNNRIRNIAADAFKGVKRVQALTLGFNRLMSLPVEALANISIGTLDLSSNKIQRLPDHSLQSHRRLKKLFLHRNEITVLTKEMFTGLYSLQEILLSDNPITKLNDAVFAETGLTNLYLFNANLTSLHGHPFITRNKALMIVSLYGNNIEFVNETVLTDLGQDCSVSLENTLKELPYIRRDLKVRLVGSGFVESITVGKQEMRVLVKSGFNCDKYPHDVYKCTPCTQGYYGGAFLSCWWCLPCLPCPPGGFFQSKTGQIIEENNTMNCQICNNGTFVSPAAHPGKTIGDCTVCPSGTDKSKHAGFRACPCSPNHHRKDRFGECSPCPLAGIDCSGEYQHLLPGFWWTWSWSTVENFEAYEKFVQNIVIENDSYDRNTKQFQGALPTVHACPRKEACDNLGDGIRATCQSGYSGFLCFQCSAGNYSSFGQCIDCPKPWAFVVEILAGIVVIVVIICAMLWNLRKHGRSAVYVLFSRIKILLGFYQIMGEIFEALHDISWPKTLTQMSSFFRILEVKITELIVSPRCYFSFSYPNVYIEFIAGLIFSAIVPLLAILAYCITKCYWRMRGNNPTTIDMSQTKQKCYLFVVIMLFLTYPGTSSAILSLLPLSCEEFHLAENGSYNTFRLRANYSIDCLDEKHVHFTYAAWISLCYVIGFPSVLLLALGKSRRQKRRNERTPSASESEQSVPNAADNGNIEIDDANESDRSIPNVDANGSSQHSGPESRRHTLVVSFESFLCENYKEQFWYWEIVELARKILQVLFVLLFGAEDPFTLFATIVLSVGFLVIHAYVKPMKDAAEHRLQMCSLITIFLNLLTASLLLSPSENDASSLRMEILAVVLVLLNLSIVIFVAGSSLWACAKFLLRRACWTRVGSGIVNCLGLLLLHLQRLRRRPDHTSDELTRLRLISGRPSVQNDNTDYIPRPI